MTLTIDENGNVSIELPPLCGRHFDPRVSQSCIKHIVDIQVNGVVYPAVHLFEQCVYLVVLAVAGVEVIQIAVEYPGFCKCCLHIRSAFFPLNHDKKSGNSEDIKKNALFKEMYRWIDNSVHLNVNDMLDAALRNTRIEMSPAERRQFYEKHIRHMTLTIDENGNVSIELKRG